ncbi:cardiolipin synthase B [Myxococcus sp. CA056]|uniref:phospholipase D-like domain-containing protein n=1 Tax=unclassified Myxococcus TaxID=2648731 RepID=UPI00157AA240|nr:cardiolipin synthase B [Myxococcus sp. CA056]NTX38060.1 cardiolipin synthase B [Myxococcus sp. CA033]NTX50861.1 cardiolipin synthase B [Myxococcus sp. CA039A]
MKLACSVLVALLVAGCPAPNHRHDLRLRSLPTGAGETRSLAFFQSLGVPLAPGHGVELVENGHVFDVLEAEIRAARSSIHIASYIWRPGEPSEQLVRAIRERHPGVACRVLVDPLGSVNFEPVGMELSNAGCEVRVFRPMQGALPSLDAARIKTRMHRKLVVRDGEVGITGGFGIWKSWLGDAEGEEFWRDMSVRVEGPVVRDMQVAFAQNWQEAGGDFLPVEAFPELAVRGGARAGFVASTQNRFLSDARRMTLLTIAAARRRLWIANSYFIPSEAISDMLLEKVKQGVDVRVVVPGRHHDIAPVHAAQRATYARLLEGGVRIWEYELSMMHSKTMLVDEDLSVVGSTNLDPLALSTSDECSLVVEDEALAARLAAAFEKDLRHSREIHWDGWRRRGLLQRLGEQLPGFIGDYL